MIEVQHRYEHSVANRFFRWLMVFAMILSMTLLTALILAFKQGEFR